MVIGLGLYTLMVKTDFDVDTILNMVCVAVIAQMFFLSLQIFGFDPYSLFGAKGNLSPTGLMANRNETSAFIAICSPAFFRRRWIYFMPLIAANLIGANSLNGVLALLLTLCAYMWLDPKVRKNKIILGSAAICMIYMLQDITPQLNLNKTVQTPTVQTPLISEESSSGQRLYIWKKSLKLTLDNQPFLGFGLGNWKNVDQYIIQKRAYKGSTSWSRLHNTFIQGYVEMGALFVVIILGYGVNIYRRYKDGVVPICALTAIFICCNTNSLFQINAIVGMFIVLWLAILEKSLVKGKQWKYF